MNHEPAYSFGFIAPTFYEAVVSAPSGLRGLLIEMRRDAREGTTVYTEVDGQPLRATSILTLFAQIPDCAALAIDHNVRVTWRGILSSAVLTETFVRNDAQSSVPWVSLRIRVGEEVFDSELRETFSDALQSLEEYTGDVHWELRTCYDCRHSLHAFPWPGSDRDDLRCFRDDPNTTDRPSTIGMHASTSFFAGQYFVNALHMCAAWRPKEKRASRPS